MKRKNGFTLVELMAVIVLIALIMTIAIPNVLRLSRSTKTKAYLTKIQMIEAAANELGNDNIGAIKGSSSYCSFGMNGNEVISAVYHGNVSESELTADLYPCKFFTVDELIIKEGRLEWDEENVCDRKQSCESEFQNNVVLNPVNSTVINKCYVYVYYKYNRIYSYFDKSKCDEDFNYCSSCNQFENNCVPCEDLDGLGEQDKYDYLGRHYLPGFGVDN